MEIDVRQILRAIFRRWWLILSLAVLFGGATYVVTNRQTAEYSAATTLLVNPQQVTSSTENSVLLASQSQAQTYVLLVESGPVLDRVNEELGLPYTRNELADKIQARVILNTQLIEISVTDPSAEEAARIANSVASQFESQIEDLTVGRLERNLMELTSQRESLQARLVEIEAELANLGTNTGDEEGQQQIRDLNEERTRAQETIADLDGSVRSVNAALATTTSPVEVADGAKAAREPDSPKPLLMTALGVFLGLIVGTGGAVILELTDKKIRRETDIEALTGSRLLATVPVPRSGLDSEPGALSLADDATIDAIRLLRTRVHSGSGHDASTAILLTDAGGAEPASRIATLLGHVMAQSGLQTVIVDANLRHPHQHRFLGKDNEPGLSAILGEDVEQQEAFSPSPVATRLGVVTAGAPVNNPSGLVVSPAFQNLLTALGNQADVVLVDAPSVLDSSDAMSIAAMVDGVVLIGQYGSTNRDDMFQTSESLRQDGIPLLGIVMIQM